MLYQSKDNCDYSSRLRLSFETFILLIKILNQIVSMHKIFKRICRRPWVQWLGCCLLGQLRPMLECLVEVLNLLPSQLPVDAYPKRKQVTAPVTGSLPSMKIEFLAPGFGLAQLRPLWELGEWTSRWKIYFYLSAFQKMTINKYFKSFKENKNHPHTTEKIHLEKWICTTLIVFIHSLNHTSQRPFE